MTFTEQEQSETGKRYLSTILLVIFAGIGGMLYGYDIGVIAGALLFIKNDIPLSAQQLSFIVAAVLGGGSFATLVTGPLADRFGRRTMITAAAIIFIAGVLILVRADTFITLIIGRLLQGVGVGIIIIAVPLYIAEVAPTSIRGRCITIFQLFLTAGILSAFLVDLMFAHSGNWRAMFLYVLIPSGLLLMGSVVLPESPRWLLCKGKKEKALSALMKLYSKQQATIELSEREKSCKQQANTSFLEAIKQLKQQRFMFPLMLALAIACLNQLTGINSILQFSALMLKDAGLNSNITAILGSVGVGLINMLATVLVFFFIDKLGRKPLLIAGTIGIVIALTAAGMISLFITSGHVKGYGLLASIVFYIFSFAIGPGVIVWLALSELLPMQIRGAGMAICLFANSMTSTILASLFMSLVGTVGYAGLFWLCATFTLLYAIIAIYYLPETKGKSLEEIELYFLKKSTDMKLKERLEIQVDQVI